MVIETLNLTKVYGTKPACADISITVRKAEIFGLLGPNGAGKSTFIKMLTGLLFPTSGAARLLGKPAGDVFAREKIGYLPENFKYQDWMTGRDLLAFHASLYKMDRKKAALRSEELLELVKMKGQEDYRIGTYSKGMQQRLGLASSLLSDPELLFLDEPTSALDPLGRKEVRDIILDLKRQGKTILLNSHLLSEVEMVCDSAAIINQGKIIAAGSLDELLGGEYTIEIRADKINPEITAGLKAIDPGVCIDNHTIRMTLQQPEFSHEVARLIIENGGRLFSLTPRKNSLENKFISLIKGEIKE
jgi:ABC-2 type transport system ATP-binding protein